MDKVDHKYLKICIYGIVSVLIALILGLLIINSSPFFAQLWSIVSAVLKPITFGLILCYLISPLTDHIEKKLKFRSKASRVIAVVLTIMLVLVVVISIAVLLYIALTRNLDSINISNVEHLYSYLESEFKKFFLSLQSIVSEGNIDMPSLGDVATSTVQEVKNTATTFLFSFVFAVHFLLDGKNILSYWKRLLNVTIDTKTQDQFKTWLKEADMCFSGYIRGQFIDALTVGLLSSVFLSLLNVPYALVVGLLTGFGNLIPYMGGILGFGSLAIACFAAGNLEAFIVGGICIGTIMVIDANIINPLLLSDNVNVHPMLVVASLIAGGAVGGLIGMLVAVPTGAFLKLQVDHYIEKRENKKETVDLTSVE